MTRTENFGWSFWNRPFLTAVAISVLWHLFWFFSVTIVVSPRKAPAPSKPPLVSLGPVLNDEIFRTLVETRLETTPAYYRPRLAGTPATDLPVENVERHVPGDVISVPFGAQAQAALAGLVSGRKAAPDFDVIDAYGSIGDSSKPAFRFEGPAADRQVLFAPPKPALPAGIDPAGRHSATRILFSIDASGSVASTEISASSGYPEIDLLWLEYLRRFQFTPEGVAAGTDKSAAVLTFGEGE